VDRDQQDLQALLRDLDRDELRRLLPVLRRLSQGETADSIMADYPDLEPDDIRACLAYAHAVIAHDSLDAVRVGLR
jgi:Flp pilus assembly CpaE family ATPase